MSGRKQGIRSTPAFIAQQHAKTLEHSQRRMREYKKTAADRKRDPHDPIGNPVFISRTDRQLLSMALDDSLHRRETEKREEAERARLREWVDEPLPQPGEDARDRARLRRELVKRIVEGRLSQYGAALVAFEDVSRRFGDRLGRSAMSEVFETLCREIGLAPAVVPVAPMPLVSDPDIGDILESIVEDEHRATVAGPPVSHQQQQQSKEEPTAIPTRVPAIAAGPPATSRSVKLNVPPPPLPPPAEAADDWMKEMDEVNEDLVRSTPADGEQQPTEDESAQFPVHATLDERS